MIQKCRNTVFSSSLLFRRQHMQWEPVFLNHYQMNTCEGVLGMEEEYDKKRSLLFSWNKGKCI